MREEPIVAGLDKRARRPAGRTAAGRTAAGQAAAAARAAMAWAAAAWTAVPRPVIALADGAVRRAARRKLTPTAASGISLALAACAAGWFSAGTRAGNGYAVIALAASWLAIGGARQLARPAAGRAAHGRIAGLCVLAGEAAVLAGLVIGGARAGWPSLWPITLTVFILIRLRETMRACSRAGGHPGGLPGALAWLALDMPASGRALLIAVVTFGWGARATLPALFAWSVVAIVSAAVIGTVRGGEAAPGPPAARPPAARPPAPAPPSAPPASGASGGPPPRVPGQMPASQQSAPPAGPAVGLAALLRSPGSGQTGTAVPGTAVPGTAASRIRPPQPPGPAAIIAACRDDGPVARWLGRIVRGNLLPLPPAVAGLAATAGLAVLGLHGLPDALMLAPLVVLVLLAGPGSSHRHDGRADWLVPALLQAAEYIYLVTAGLAAAVPAPLIFALCAACAALHADLAPAPGPAGGARSALETGLGWEGRMFIAGLGAAAGIGTLAYLGLAGYLGGLVCGSVARVTGPPASQPDAASRAPAASSR